MFETGCAPKDRPSNPTKSQSRWLMLSTIISFTMSDLHDVATVDESNDNVYIYTGGKVDEKNKDAIEHVRVDESITIIDDKAFHECTNIRTVYFSMNHNALMKIGNKSFAGCLNLLSINLQNTAVETIGDRTFFGCGELTTIQFPSSIRHIGKSCFAGCRQLKVVDLAHAYNLEKIEDSTFAHCTVMTTINLPPTVSYIGKESFLWCKALEMIDLRSTCINEIGEGAFYMCMNLSTVYFPTTIKSIGKDGFCHCQNLLCLDLQTTSIETIGDNSFINCNNLETIYFPKTLKYIGKYCFRSCAKLEHLNLQETFIECIKEGAFYNCTNLKTVPGISTTDDETFHDDDDDDDFDMNLPASLVEIGEDCFSSCPNFRKFIGNNCIHYECDINRGGRQFLQRHHHDDNHNSNSENDANKRRGKVYYYSLWPLILYRVMNDIEVPQHEICSENDDDLSLYTSANPRQRRASVVYYLMVHGVVADLQPYSGKWTNPKQGTLINSFFQMDKQKKKKADR